MNILQEIVEASDFLAKFSKASSKPIQYTLVGSAGYLSTAKDVDFLVRPLKGDYIDLVLLFQEQGFVDCAPAGEYDEEEFIALRKGNLNLICCDDLGFYERFVSAYTVCKALRLERKYDRILVHALVRDRMTMYEAKIKALPWLEVTIKTTTTQVVPGKHNLLIYNLGIDAFGRRQLWGAQT